MVDTFALHTEEILQLKVLVACRCHFVEVGLGSGGCVREVVLLSCGMVVWCRAEMSA